MSQNVKSMGIVFVTFALLFRNARWKHLWEDWSWLVVSEGSVTLSLGSVLLDLLHMVCSGSELLPLWLTGRRGREGGRREE